MEEDMRSERASTLLGLTSVLATLVC